MVNTILERLSHCDLIKIMEKNKKTRNCHVRGFIPRREAINTRHIHDVLVDHDKCSDSSRNRLANRSKSLP